MLDENYWIEKSMSLVWAKLTDYGAGELKILDTYLSRINARDPESSRVMFTKKEYAELMGLDADIRTEQLKKYTAKLLKNVVTVDLPDGRDGYAQYPLFVEAETELDKTLGQTVIRIDCHPKLKQAFFELSADRYVKYQLKNTIALKSQYSIRLYSILMAQHFSWTVGVQELRERLNATNPAYTEFKRFNNLVLKKAVAEINEVTNMTVDVEHIKKGRSIVSVKFIIKIENPKSEPEDEEPIILDALPDDIPDINDRLALCASALPAHFTRNEVDYLRSLAMVHVPFEVINLTEKELWMHDYLDSKRKLMMVQKRTVLKENQFSWLCRAVEENWKK